LGPDHPQKEIYEESKHGNVYFTNKEKMNLNADRWIVGEEAPVSVSAHGGQYAIDDDRTIPDTMQATFEFASGRLLMFGQYEASGTTPFAKSGEIELRGTEGTLYASGGGYEIVPARGGQFQDATPRMEAVKGKAKGGNGDLTTLHMRNFLDAVRSHKYSDLNAPMETGRLSAVYCHLGNMSYRLGQPAPTDIPNPGSKFRLHKLTDD